MINKKILVTGLVLASILFSVPAFATTSTEDRFVEAQRKLEERFAEAKRKLQDKITAYNNKKANQAATIQCVAAAVNVREAAIGAAFNAYSGSQTTALSTRAAALNAAWSAPSSTSKTIKTATDLAWKNYRLAHQTAVKTHNTASRTAWDNFKNASKSCKTSATGVSVDMRGSGVDSVQ